MGYIFIKRRREHARKRELARKKRLHALYDTSYEYIDSERRAMFDELLSMRGKTLNSAEAERMIELIHKINRTGDNNGTEDAKNI